MKISEQTRTLHGGDIGRLDVVLIFSDLLLEFVKGNLLVLDDESHLKLLDTVTDIDEFGRSPNETVLLDSTNVCLKFLHVGLIIPRLYIKGNNGLFGWCM